jgi:hypothetical protein
MTTCGISVPFGPLSPTSRQVTYVLLTRLPLHEPKPAPFDLHALGTPPAFILSQDQTLHIILASSLSVLTLVLNLSKVSLRVSPLPFLLKVRSSLFTW